jgi:RND family efflux transporter MFP subunit
VALLNIYGGGVVNRLLIMALMIVASAVAGGCSAQKPAEKLPAIVKMQKAGEYTAPAELRYSAAVNPANQVDLSFRAPGYVQYVLQVRGSDGILRSVQAGDYVTRGTVLAGVKQEEYQLRVREQAAVFDEMSLNQTKTQAGVAEAEAALADARLDFNRAEQLFQTASMTKPDYDAAKSRLEVSQARVAQAKAQIGANEATERRIKATIGEARSALQDTTLRAPVDGVVMKRNVEIGTLVGTGTVGFTLADTRSVKVSFGVPDVELKNIRAGGTANIISEAVPGKVFQGRITEISPSADPSTRVFNVEVTIANRDNALKVGMITSLALASSEPVKPAVVVPLSAIVRASSNDQGYSVFVLRNQGGKFVAEERPVELGDAHGELIAVLSGIKSGDDVVTTGNTRLLSGEEVRITD